MRRSSARRPDAVSVCENLGAGPLPRNPGLETGDCSPAEIAATIRGRFPDDGLLGIIESRRRHADDRKRIAIDADGGTQRPGLAGIQALPQPITNDRDGVRPRRSPPVPLHFLAGSEGAAQYGLRAEKLEEIPRGLRYVSSLPFARAAQVDVSGFPEGGVGEIVALRAPIVKMPRAVERRKEYL